MADRSVAVKLRMEVSDYLAKAKQASKATSDFLGELGKSKKASSELSDGLLVAGGALAGGFLIGVKTAAQFEKQMSHVQAATKASAAQMEQLRAAAIRAGQDTVFSASDAAKAQEELAKAGLSTADILGGALSGALDLAAAGNIDLAEAADIAAKAMNTFGLKGKDVGHIGDMLAGAANATATDVHEMGEALRMGGLAANSMGVSLDDTVVTLGAFADKALVGSDAGTSLKTMLQMLAAPTEKSANLMRELGIKAFDAQGQFVGMSKLAQNLQESLGGMSQEQRTAAIATIFGADAMRAANVLYDLGADGLAKYNQEINDQADASATAATKTDNLVGDIERLKGSLETLAIESGSGPASGLRTLVQGTDNLVTSLGLIPAGVQSFAVGATGVVGASALMAGATLKAREKVAELTQSLSDAGPTGAKAAKGINVAAGAVGRLAVTLTAFQIASAALGSQVSPQVDALSKDLIEFGKSGKFAGEGTRMFGKDLDNLKYDLGTLDTSALAEFGNGFAGVVEGLTGTGAVFDQSLFHAQERIRGLDTALAQLVQSGKTDEAKAAFEQLTKVAKEQGVSVEELTKGLPQYAAAMEGATSAQTNAIAATERNNQTTKMLTGSLSDAISTLGSFEAAFERFNGAQLSVNETTIAAEQAVDDLTESIKKNKGSLDLSTEAGRNNQQALDELARKAAEAAEAVYKQTGSASAAAAVFETYRQQMINAYIAMGKSRAEAEKLTNQLMSIPKDIPVDITVTTRYRTEGTPSRGNSRYPGINSADGNIIEYYAAGGVRENHIAQIAPAGAWRVWAEPETGGEAYIPLAAAKRPRSTQILAEANRRMGYPLSPWSVAASAPNSTPDAATTARTQQYPIDPVVLGQALRFALAGMAVTLDSARVGQVQGREGDLLRRGG